MIKCKINRPKTVRVSANGTTHDLVVETTMLIKLVHDGIRQQSEAEAAKYRKAVIGVLLDPNTPVWKV